MAEEVKNLGEALLPQYLGEDGEIVECDTKRLTVAGENYGSLMLALEVKIKNKSDKKETILHVVAKAVPTNEFIRRVFKSPLTFKKELGLYRIIVPTIKDFVRESGVEIKVDFFPEFYGGRLSLGPNFDVFDDDAVILLENLKVRGFVCEDRRKGFDLETAKLIIKDLATFHAVSIALKLKKPEVFRDKCLPYLNHVSLFDEFQEDATNNMFDDAVNVAKEHPGCLPYLKRLRAAMATGFDWFTHPNEPREPFSTIAHFDFWVNNIMLKRTKVETSIKIVDYQFVEYGSPVRDLIMFIFDSVQNHVVVEHCDSLINFYHQTFIEILEKFSIDTAPFSMEKFREEISLGVKEFTITQCIIMVKPIFAEDHTVKEVDQIGENDFTDKYEVPQGHKEKVWMIVEQCGKRGWI